jgi:hypothetical protein
MEDRIEYKISFSKDDEQKSFNLVSSDGEFKGSVCVNKDSVYINLIELKLTPTAEKRRFKEVRH